MSKKNTQNKLQKKLEKLSILEFKEKSKLKDMYKQLEIIKTLENKEKMKLEKMKNKKNNTAKTIGKIALITALTTGAVLSTNEMRKDRQKNQVQWEDENKNSDENQEIDNTTIFPTKKLITEDILKKNITKEQLDPMISYKKIADVVNNIENDKVREELIEYLQEGKIVEVQEIYGMKRNSKYPSNKATGKIDENTLQRFGDKLFGLYGKEILEHKEIPQEAKDIYQKFLLGEINNNDAAYIILCKSNFYLYLFTKDHKLLHRQISLLGKDMGNNEEWVPYNYYKTNKGFIYHKKAVNTNTPEGLFLIQRTCNLANNYICDGPKVGLVAVPINEKTQKTEKRYEYDKYEKRFHPVRQPPKDKDKYEKAINSTETGDNAISHGCPNVKNIGVLLDNLTIGKSVEYTTKK